MPIDGALILKKAPNGPGVYVMKGVDGQYLYIGKAKNIRNRFKAYFPEVTDSRWTIRHVLRRVDTIEFVTTQNEQEALLLENNLIKAHKPKFNILFRDDKSYHLICIQKDHPFPRIYMTRNRKAAGIYFGPYASSVKLRETIKAIRRTFGIRGCRDAIFKNRVRPCLDYEIGLCTAPCVGKVTKLQYNADLSNVKQVLAGNIEGVVDTLKGKMVAASEAMDYERAKRFRDQVRAIEETIDDQLVDTVRRIDGDVWGISVGRGNAVVIRLAVRSGKVVDVNRFGVRHKRFSEPEILNDVVTQFYLGGCPLPREVIVPFPIADGSLLKTIGAGEHVSRLCRVIAPGRGARRQLLNLAHENARQHILSEGGAGIDTAHLQSVLRLKRRPAVVECYDISTMQGYCSVGAKVTFIYGEPDKSLYRHYKIKGVWRGDGEDPLPNDYMMMEELLTRRLTRLTTGLTERPDLICIDGGRGHLAVGQSVLARLCLLDCIDIIAIAKPRAGEPSDKIYILDRQHPIWLPLGSNELRFFQRIRDEAHRFGVSFHRKLREKL